MSTGDHRLLVQRCKNRMEGRRRCGILSDEQHALVKHTIDTYAKILKFAARGAAPNNPEIVRVPMARSYTTLLKFGTDFLRMEGAFYTLDPTSSDHPAVEVFMAYVVWCESAVVDSEVEFWTIIRPHMAPDRMLQAQQKRCRGSEEKKGLSHIHYSSKSIRLDILESDRTRTGPLPYERAVFTK
jgi:hypothetical protein